MDVFQISGLKFRMMPNLTVRMIIDVFSAAGRKGLLKKNGVVEYLDTVVVIEDGIQYEFEQFNGDALKNAGSLLPINATDFYPLGTIDKESRRFETIDKELHPLEAINKETYRLGTTNKELYALGNTNRELYALGNTNKELYALDTAGKELYTMGNTDRELYASGNPNRKLYDLRNPNRELYALGNPNRELYAFGDNNRELYALDSANKEFYPLGTTNRELFPLGTNNKETVPQGNQVTSVIKGNGFLDGAQMMQTLYPLEYRSTFPTELSERQVFPGASAGFRSDIMFPLSYTVVEVRAADEKFLCLNQIEVYHQSGHNIASLARLESSADINETALSKIVNGVSDKQNMFRSLQTGEWIRLRFENKSGLSNIVLRNNRIDNDRDLIHSLRDAILSVKSIDEYVLRGDLTDYQFINTYTEDIIDTVEIEATTPADLQLQGLDIINHEGVRVPIEAMYLNGKSQMRVVLPRPTLIKSIKFLGKAKDLKLYMQVVRKFTCSGDNVQRFYL